MDVVKPGSTVKVSYTGKLSDGIVFDRSSEEDPFEFAVGAGQVIPGFEKAVVGMRVGERANVTVAAEDAYGPLRDDLIGDVPRDQFPEDIDLTEGNRLELQQEDGKTWYFTVLEADEETVKLDMNHPLAGKELVFEIELLAIS